MRSGPGRGRALLPSIPLGGRVAYRRQASDKTFVTVVHDRATGRETTLANAIEPSRWSRDGRTIFGTEYPGPSGSVQSGKIVACDADGPCRTLAQGDAGRPSHDDTQVFFLRIVRPGRVDRELWSVDSDGKNLRKIAVISPWDVERSCVRCFTRQPHRTGEAALERAPALACRSEMTSRLDRV